MRGRAKGKRRVVGEAEGGGDRGEREEWRMRKEISRKLNSDLKETTLHQEYKKSNQQETVQIYQ